MNLCHGIIRLIGNESLSEADTDRLLLPAALPIGHVCIKSVGGDEIEAKIQRTH